MQNIGAFVVLALSALACGSHGDSGGPGSDPDAVAITSSSCAATNQVADASGIATYAGTASGSVGTTIGFSISNGGVAANTPVTCGGWTQTGYSGDNANNVGCQRNSGQPVSISWTVHQPVYSSSYTPGDNVKHIIVRFADGSKSLTATQDVTCP